MEAMEPILFILAGAASGFFSGALGVGGASLATPLIRFLGVSPFLAIGSTVPALLPSTITGALTYAKAGFVDRRSTAYTAAGGVAATVAGAYTTRVVPGEGHLLMIITSIVLFFLAMRVIPSKGVAEPTVVQRSPAITLLAIGAATGFFSGLLGIGGGFMMVPLFLRALHMPTKVALGTSLAVITITVIPNIAAQWAVGNIDWAVAGLLAIGVVPGARLGAKAAIRANQRSLRIAFAIALGAIALTYATFEAVELMRDGLSF